MVGTAGSFQSQLRIFAKNAEAAIDQVQRKVALDIFSRVIMRTPVDTGRARANWQLLIGEGLPSGTVEADDKGTVSQNGSGNSRTKASVVEQVLAASDTKRIVLANNLPYIGILEYGRDDGSPGSQQAPAGMVRVTVTEFEDLVRKAGGEVRRL
jgi:hypothetical protein